MSTIAHLPRRMLPAALRAAQIALVLVILWLLAGWFWALLTPTPAIPAPAPRLDAAGAVADITAAHPFGAGAAPAAGSAAAPAAATANIVLRGVIAGKARKRTAAIVSVNGGEPQVFAEGDAIASGVTLDRVYSDRIEVRTAGGRQRIELAR